MIYIKIHDTENGAIVAMCDQSLITKTLSEGDLFIDIKTYSSFYKGELVEREAAMELIASRPISSANVVGEESIGIAVEMELIEESAVLSAEGVPYAQAYVVVGKA
ncbi:MAG TPA: DUF424 family protein [Candidatus Acidoferrales bacterium]|nr:DUF424 family protein [Candidatus Acidoferrales bacterium]